MLFICLVIFAIIGVFYSKERIRCETHSTVNGLKNRGVSRVFTDRHYFLTVENESFYLEVKENNGKTKKVDVTEFVDDPSRIGTCANHRCKICRKCYDNILHDLETENIEEFEVHADQESCKRGDSYFLSTDTSEFDDRLEKYEKSQHSVVEYEYSVDENDGDDECIIETKPSGEMLPNEYKIRVERERAKVFFGDISLFVDGVWRLLQGCKGIDKTQLNQETTHPWTWDGEYSFVGMRMTIVFKCPCPKLNGKYEEFNWELSGRVEFHSGERRRNLMDYTVVGAAFSSKITITNLIDFLDFLVVPHMSVNTLSDYQSHFASYWWNRSERFFGEYSQAVGGEIIGVGIDDTFCKTQKCGRLARNGFTSLVDDSNGIVVKLLGWSTEQIFDKNGNFVPFYQFPEKKFKTISQFGNYYGFWWVRNELTEICSIKFMTGDACVDNEQEMKDLKNDEIILWDYLDIWHRFKSKAKVLSPLIQRNVLKRGDFGVWMYSAIKINVGDYGSIVSRKTFRYLLKTWPTVIDLNPLDDLSDTTIVKYIKSSNEDYVKMISFEKKKLPDFCLKEEIFQLQLIVADALNYNSCHEDYLDDLKESFDVLFQNVDDDDDGYDVVEEIGSAIDTLKTEKDPMKVKLLLGVLNGIFTTFSTLSENLSKKQIESLSVERIKLILSVVEDLTFKSNTLKPALIKKAFEYDCEESECDHLFLKYLKKIVQSNDFVSSLSKVAFFKCPRIDLHRVQYGRKTSGNENFFGVMHGFGKAHQDKFALAMGKGGLSQISYNEKKMLKMLIECIFISDLESCINSDNCPFCPKSLVIKHRHNVVYEGLYDVIENDRGKSLEIWKEFEKKWETAGGKKRGPKDETESEDESDDESESESESENDD